MEAFYKIIDNKAQVGSGTPPDNTWVVYEIGQEPEELKEVLALEAIEQAKQDLKQAKEQAKINIKVMTSNNNMFDGNESARNNMISAITSSEVLGITETQWKLADNNIVTISLTELKEALALSIQECGRIILAQSIEEL